MTERRVAAILLIFLPLAMLLPAAVQGESSKAPITERDVVRIESVQVVDLDHPEQPTDLTLPAQHLRAPRTFKQFRMRANFVVPDVQVSKLWAIYIASFSHGGTLRINGVEVGDVQTSTPQMTVWHTRPYIFPVANSLLKNGNNQLELTWGARESLTLLSRIFIGPISVVMPHYEQRLFWQNTMALVALVHALVIATILLGIYSLKRQQKSYLLMGIGAIGFSIIVLAYMLPAMPWALYPYWRFTHISGIALFTTCAWLFLIHEGYPENRWFPRLCIGWGVLGPVVYLVHFWLTDISFYRTFETFWGVMAGVIGFYPVATLVRSLWRQWAWRNLIFSVATAFAIVMGIADIVLQGTASSVFGNVGYSMQAVSPLWFTALTAVLVTDFVASLTEQDRQRKLMACKLAEQQSQLALFYRNSQQRELERAALDERQRIMQDMHDGLGSQLVTSLAMCERGVLTNEQVSLLLRECIDDLRLAIDTMSDSDGQFDVIAGNLRFRMEPRLRVAGIALKWESSSVGEQIVVPASKMLPLLRIMQESITNTLKHADASEIRVTIYSTADTLRVQVCDNGKGFSATLVRSGKGISGMEKRARGIGANYTISGVNGTTVQVELALETQPLELRRPGAELLPAQS